MNKDQKKAFAENPEAFATGLLGTIEQLTQERDAAIKSLEEGNKAIEAAENKVTEANESLLSAKNVLKEKESQIEQLTQERDAAIAAKAESAFSPEVKEFTVDKKSYCFNSAVRKINVKGKVLTVDEALKDQEVLNYLVHVQAGIISIVEPSK